MSVLRKMSAALKSTGSTLALAESCTGGLISMKITQDSGSSDYFIGSAVTYSNISKSRILGVSPETLSKFGAVSEEAAIEMAKGAAEAFLSDYAASVTGIAGPNGGTKRKPVGTVCIGLTDGRRSLAFTKHFEGTREEVREQTAEEVFELLAEFITEKI